MSVVNESTGSSLSSSSGVEGVLHGATATENYDYIGAVLRRKEMMLSGIAVALVIGMLYFWSRSPEYATSTTLMIWTQTPPSVVQPEAMHQPDLLGKHEHLIASRLVLSKAIENGQLQKMQTFEDSSDITRELVSMLEIEPARDAEDTLFITLTGPNEEELPVILNAIVSSYKGILESDTEQFGQESSELMEKLQTKIADNKDEQEQRYFALIQELNLSRDAASGQYLNPYSLELASLQNQYSEARLELRDVQDRIAGLPDLSTAEPETLKVASLEASHFLGFDSQRNSPRSRENMLQTKAFEYEQRVAELELKSQRIVDSIGENHPSAQNVLAELEFYKKELQNLTAQQFNLDQSEENESKNSLLAVKSSDRELLKMYQSKLHREINRLERTLGNYTAEMHTMDAKSKALAPKVSELNTLASSIEEKGTVLQDIVDRLSEIAVVASNYTSTKVRVIDPPQVGDQVAPSLPLYLLGSIAFGAIGSFALGVALDWSSYSFRSPAEIESSLGIPVVTRVPQIDQELNGNDVHLTILGQPHSEAAESYRTCRTAMLFAANEKSGSTFLITSPAAGDGKSTTAVNLAIAVAKGGKKVVLVDSDLRRPRCAAYMSVEGQGGLDQLSLGDLALHEVVQASQTHENLSFVSAGAGVANPAEFLESECFAELVEQLRNDFDIVIFDSPPILPVADAAAIAKFADHVLLVFKIRRGITLAAEKATEVLRRVGANLMGVVVNDVDKGCHYSDYGKSGYSGFGSSSYYVNRYYGPQNAEYYQQANDRGSDKRGLAKSQVPAIQTQTVHDNAAV